MSKRLDVSGLADLRDRLRRERAVEAESARATVTVHMGTCGIAAGARDVMGALRQTLEDLDVHDVHLTTSGCAGLCSREPMLTVQLRGGAPVKYVEMDTERAVRVLKGHALEGKVVEEFALAVGSERTG